MSQILTDSLIQERFRSDDAFLSDSELSAAIEALLMVAESPTCPADLAMAIGVDVRESKRRCTISSGNHPVGAGSFSATKTWSS